MISISYINGSDIDIPAYDPFNTFESELNDILDAVNTAYNEYQEAMNEYNISVEFFESGDDTKLEAAEEKKTNFVDRIGAAIIEVGKKAVAFINNIITKIQESLFANKTDMQKVSALCKKNPGMADDINKAFKDGNLQVADLKSIKELESAYDEIMRLAKQENVDPNTLKGKWANAKKKFGNMSEADIIKGVTATISVATVASALVINLGKLPEAISNIKNWKQNAKDKTETAELTMRKLRAETEAAEHKRDQAARSDKFDADTYNDRKSKAASDAKSAKLNADYADKTHNEQIRITKANAAKAQEEVRQARTNTKEKALNTLVKGSFESAEDLTFDENGYMTESASDALRGVISSIHADMMKVYTTLANFNFRNLSRAKAIIAAAIRGYEKTPKTIDKKEDNNDQEDEESNDEE